VAGYLLSFGADRALCIKASGKWTRALKAVNIV